MPAASSARHRLLLELLHAGLESVDGRCRVREALLSRPPAAHAAPVWAAAVGKAAASMALGAVDALGSSLARVLVITKGGHLSPELLAVPGVETSPMSFWSENCPTCSAADGALHKIAVPINNANSRMPLPLFGE